MNVGLLWFDFDETARTRSRYIARPQLVEALDWSQISALHTFLHSLCPPMLAEHRARRCQRPSFAASPALSPVANELIAKYLSCALLGMDSVALQVSLDSFGTKCLD